MRKIAMVVGMVALVAGLAWCASLSAAPVMQVDFQNIGEQPKNGPVIGLQSGWFQGGKDANDVWSDWNNDTIWGALELTNGWTQSLGPEPAAYHLNVSNGADQYIHSDMNDITGLSGSVTLGDMYRDGFNQGAWGGSKTVTYTIGGLTSGQAYEMTVWVWSQPAGYYITRYWSDELNDYVYVPHADYNVDFADVTNGTVAKGSILQDAALPTSDSSYSLTFGVTADDFGNITIQSSQAQGYAYIVNGFSVAQVPEPATMMLFGTGVLGVFGYIRRQRMK